MSTELRLGRLPKREDPRTLRLARYLPAVPTAPARLHLQRLVPSWPMYANDQLGDCTCAAAGHMVELWGAQVGAPALPDTAAVVAMYYAITGGQDTGAVMLDVLRYWQAHELGGTTPYAYAEVDPAQREHVRAAAWLFGGLYLGLELPLSAQAQVGVRSWVPVSGPSGEPGSWGGHAVNVVGYSRDGVWVITWGQLQRMTWGFWRRYVDECWAVLPSAYTGQAAKAHGFDLAALQADLQALGHPA